MGGSGTRECQYSDYTNYMSMSMDTILAKFQDYLSAGISGQLSPPLHLRSSSSSDDHVLIDAPTPAQLYRYHSTFNSSMRDAMLLALKRRIDAARHLMPQAKLYISGHSSMWREPAPAPWVEASDRGARETYIRAGELGVYDNLTYVMASVYSRVAYEDVDEYVQRSVEIASGLTDSTGRVLPVIAALSLGKGGRPTDTPAKANRFVHNLRKRRDIAAIVWRIADWSDDVTRYFEESRLVPAACGCSLPPPCFSVDCGENGVCQSSGPVSVPHCRCSKGFHGPKCDTPPPVIGMAEASLVNLVPASCTLSVEVRRLFAPEASAVAKVRLLGAQGVAELLFNETLMWGGGDSASRFVSLRIVSDPQSENQSSEPLAEFFIILFNATVPSSVQCDELQEFDVAKAKVQDFQTKFGQAGSVGCVAHVVVDLKAKFKDKWVGNFTAGGI